jgi:hypothetical protein
MERLVGAIRADMVGQIYYGTEIVIARGGEVLPLEKPNLIKRCKPH